MVHTAKAYYAFNKGGDGGFVLVASDNSFSKPILGYADKGTFDIENMPENMRWWIDGYDRMLEAAQETSIKGSDAVQARVHVKRANIDPMVTAQWDQSSPYNAMSPTYNGIRCPTGCLTTALAQLVYYNRYPAQGEGSYSYEWTVNRVSQGFLSTDFSQHTYDYNVMCNTYDDSSSIESCQAVAQLMYDLGVLAETAYKPAISSAPMFTTLKRIIKHLKYDKSAIIRSREFYTDKEWIDMVYENLAEGYPLCYTGSNEWAGHAFVCDGYKDGYFHINWGWSGNSNGYFLLDALSPGNQGIGGSSGGYNDMQEAIFNFKPLQPYSKYEVLMYNYSNFDIEQKQQTNTDIATFTGSFNNLGFADQTIVLGLKVVDDNGDITWLTELNSSKINSLAAVKSIVVDLSNFPNADGNYRVYPAYQDENGEWKELRTKSNFTKRYMNATVSGKNITFAHQLEFTSWSNTKIVAEKEFSISVNIKNVAETYFSDKLRLALIEYTTDNAVCYSNEIPVNISSGNTAYTTFNLTAPKEFGLFNYAVVNSKGNVISDILRLVVEENTETTDEYTLTLNSLNVANANNAALDDINILAQITCEKGRYNGNMAFFIYPQTGNYYTDYLTQNFYIREGETKILKNTDNFYGLQVGHTYRVRLCYEDRAALLWKQLGNEQYFTITATTGIDEITNYETTDETFVYNLSGRCLLHFKANELVNTYSLSPGVYLTKTGKTTKQIVITK